MTPEALDSLSKQELIALVLALMEQNQQIQVLAEQNKALAARVAELEAKLNIPPKTPGNSSLPPSKGQKANKPEKAKKERKGRPGVARKLSENPDRVLEMFASSCPHCGNTASPGDQPHVHAYDHIDLPEIKPVVTRVNLHSGACGCCGQRIAGTPPAGMQPGSPFGPGIVALAVYLHTRQMVSYNRLVEMFKGLFGLDISEGAIANLFNRAQASFAAEAERIDAEVRASPVIASDETSARVEGVTGWQWVFGCATAVAHFIAASRGKAVVTEFLKGAVPEVWVRTGWARRWAMPRRIKSASPISCATPVTPSRPETSCSRRASKAAQARLRYRKAPRKTGGQHACGLPARTGPPPRPAAGNRTRYGSGPETQARHRKMP